MNVQNQLLKFIKTTLIKDRSVKLAPATLLFEDGLIDSMNILYLIGFLEKNLGRRLTNAEIQMDHVKSVNAIIESFFHDQQK